MSRQDSSDTTRLPNTPRGRSLRRAPTLNLRDAQEIAAGSVDAERCRVRCVHPEMVAAAQARLALPATYQAVASLFAALADPTRATLVHILLHQELCTCDLAAVLGVSDSAVSQHLRILRTLHVVKSRRAGKFVYYSLDDAHVALLLQVGLTHSGHEDPVASTNVDDVLAVENEEASS